VIARIPPWQRQEIAADVAAQLRRLFPRADRFFAGGADAPPMPPVLGLLARHPAIAGPWLAYNGALLDDGVLDAHTRELLILATVRRTGSAYLWQEHLRLAAVAGVTPDEIAALAGVTPRAWSERDGALLRAVDELVADQVVTDDTWQVVSRHFDDRQLIELLFVAGTYTCLAMVLKSAGLTSEEEQP
jgi:4-carboxymuconolactone decarboxylase